MDSGFTPLIVHDSYPSVALAGLQSDRQSQWARLERLARAADYICHGDVVGNRIASQQLWTLAPLHGVLSCVAPGFCANGSLARTSFPSWLGRNSTSIKRIKLLREISSHLGARVSATKEEVRQAYVPALRAPLVRPMAERGADGVGKVIELLDEYNLSKARNPQRIWPYLAHLTTPPKFLPHPTAG